MTKQNQKFSNHIGRCFFEPSCAEHPWVPDRRGGKGLTTTLKYAIQMPVRYNLYIATTLHHNILTKNLEVSSQYSIGWCICSGSNVWSLHHAKPISENNNIWWTHDFVSVYVSETNHQQTKVPNEPTMVSTPEKNSTHTRSCKNQWYYNLRMQC